MKYNNKDILYLLRLKAAGCAERCTATSRTTRKSCRAASAILPLSTYLCFVIVMKTYEVMNYKQTKNNINIQPAILFAFWYNWL